MNNIPPVSRQTSSNSLFDYSPIFVVAFITTVFISVVIYIAREFVRDRVRYREGIFKDRIKDLTEKHEESEKKRQQLLIETTQKTEKIKILTQKNEQLQREIKQLEQKTQFQNKVSDGVIEEESDGDEDKALETATSYYSFEELEEKKKTNTVCIEDLERINWNEIDSRLGYKKFYSFLKKLAGGIGRGVMSKKVSIAEKDCDNILNSLPWGKLETREDFVELAFLLLEKRKGCFLKDNTRSIFVKKNGGLKVGTGRNKNKALIFENDKMIFYFYKLLLDKEFRADGRYPHPRLTRRVQDLKENVTALHERCIKNLFDRPLQDQIDFIHLLSNRGFYIGEEQPRPCVGFVKQGLTEFRFDVDKLSETQKETLVEAFNTIKIRNTSLVEAQVMQ